METKTGVKITELAEIMAKCHREITARGEMVGNEISATDYLTGKLFDAVVGPEPQTEPEKPGVNLKTAALKMLDIIKPEEAEHKADEIVLAMKALAGIMIWRYEGL